MIAAEAILTVGERRGAAIAEPYLVVAGSTAVGKSGVALAVAARLDGEIVNADSRQVYRRIDIGTAKPTPAERARVPHHLVDVVELGEPYTAADYARGARVAIADIQARGRVAVVCGGTGFYLDALAGGLGAIEEDAAPADRAAAARRVRKIPSGGRHAALAEVDPESAARIHPNDRQRVDRALEVWFLTGAPLSALGPGEGRLPHVAVRLHRPRSELRARIEARLDAMLAAGLEAEARALWEEGWSPEAPGLDTIGYQEWWPYFEGRSSRDEAVRRILVATRRYAKRQETWFRHRTGYRAVPAEGATEAVVAAWRRRTAGESG